MKKKMKLYLIIAIFAIIISLFVIFYFFHPFELIGIIPQGSEPIPGQPVIGAVPL